MKKNNLIIYFIISITLSFLFSPGTTAQTILEIKVDTLEVPETVSFDTSELEPGIYLLKIVTSEGNFYCRKISKT